MYLGTDVVKSAKGFSTPGTTTVGETVPILQVPAPLSITTVRWLIFGTDLWRCLFYKKQLRV